MISEHVRMWWRRSILVGVVLAAGCTKPNPRSCADGTCTDPAFPFCDVGGELSGTPKQCIAVTCNPGDVDLCRGDQAVTCNAEGTDYDIVQCELGCDESLGGCRLCEPNETACTNGTVATCDANGTVTASEECALGCFEDEPRCRAIKPSNNLAMYLDMVADPPDVEISNAIIYTGNGQVLDGSTPVTIPSFRHAQGNSGQFVRVFVVNSLRLTSASINVDQQDPRLGAGEAVAFVSRRDIVLGGNIDIAPRVGGAVSNCAAGEGAYAEGSGYAVGRAGGGGGNATAGGDGGTPVPGSPAGPGDPSSGGPELVPLRGGCGGGFTEVGGISSNGGGAIQLSSGTSITINGTINVMGQPGEAEQVPVNAVTVGGAGAGGSILIEAPRLELGTDAKLLATGGKGGMGCTTASTHCGDGGAGATVASPAGGHGMNVPVNTTPGSITTTGGGGGGLGRLRINTPDQIYTKASSAVEAGALTTGVLSTR